MKNLKKLLKVLGTHVSYVIILLVAVLFFAIYSDGFVYGIITALSALIAYVCIDILYKEYKKVSAPKNTKQAVVKKTKKKSK